MNESNTKKLFKKFSFLNKKNLPDGFNCGDGWSTLVHDMCKELKAVSPPNDFAITKIAEKNGALVVHSKNGVMRTRVVIDEYNTTSMELCDSCGNNVDLEKCAKCTAPVIVYPDPVEEKETVDDKDDTAHTCNQSVCPPSGGT